MKNLFLLALAFLCGCKVTGTIAIRRHDGGTNYYNYLAVGGIVRPGVIVVFAESASNGPPPLVHGIGPPIAPSITGAAGNVAAAATLSGLWPDHGDKHSTTTVIQDEPRAPIIPPPPIPVPSRPPFGPPPWHGQHPNNRGH